jgi:hypothetical protein
MCHCCDQDNILLTTKPGDPCELTAKVAGGWAGG